MLSLQLKYYYTMVLHKMIDGFHCAKYYTTPIISIFPINESLHFIRSKTGNIPLGNKIPNKKKILHKIEMPQILNTIRYVGHSIYSGDIKIDPRSEYHLS